MWRIQLFGKVSAREGDHLEDRFSTRKNAELLGYLAMSPGSSFSRRHLCEVLWPDADDVDAARVRLRQSISSIRRQLEPPGVESGSVLVTERDMVWLNRARVESDAAEFELTLSLLDGSPPHKRKKYLDRILDLHRDEFMAGLSAGWIISEQERFHKRFVEAADALVALCFAEGDWQGAASALKRTMAVERYDEERGLRLMAAYRYLGQFGNALAVYDEVANRLRSDLGSEPSAEFSQMASSIRAEADSGIRSLIRQPERMASHEQRERTRRFPSPSTRFYGRTQEIAALHSLIDDPSTRLVTLLGPGGVGKTRLALELAEQVYFERSGDVWFVPLADLPIGQEISGAILGALSLDQHGGSGAADMIADQLRGIDRPLLILDNIEHVIDEGADLVSQLTVRLPNLCILVTSRQPLEVAGEHEFRIGLLSVPPVEASTPDQLMTSPGVQLFVDRAKLVKPDFQVTPGNCAAVGELCRQLEGIPLAIETCAALSQTITPARMIEGLNRRFELLVSRRRDIVPRHRTLRAAIEYSYRMLPPDLAFIFRQLAIFQGGWSVKSAQSVLGPTNMEEAFRQLQKLSLITCEEVSIDGQPTLRFRMLETFRLFAWEMLSSGEQERLALCHQIYFSQFANLQREKYFKNAANVDELELEQANLTAVIRWHLAEGNLQDAMQLCNDLFHFWMIKGRLGDGLFWFQSLLDHPQISDVPTRVRCRGARGLLHLVISSSGLVGADEALNRYFRLAEELAEPSDLVHALSIKGTYAAAMGDSATAIQLCETALAGARKLGGSEPGNVLTDLFDIRYGAGDYLEALEHCAEAYPISKSSGFRLNACNALNTWASCLAMLGRYEEAKSKFEEALREAEEVGAPAAVISVHLGLAALFINRERWTEAGLWLEKAFQMILGSPGAKEFRRALQLASLIAMNKGQTEIAIQLSAAGDSLPFILDRHRPLYDGLAPDLSDVRDRLKSQFEILWVQGQGLSRREMAQLALKILIIEKPAEPTFAS